MKSIQKGFSILIVIIIVIVLFGAVGVFVYITQKNTPPLLLQQANQAQPVQNPKPILKIIPSKSVSTSPLILTGNTNLNGKAGENFVYNFTASGGLPPYHYQLESGAGFPPTGIILDTNGKLSGTPKARGVSTFSVCVVDTAGISKCKNINFNVQPTDVIATPPPSTLTFKATATSITCANGWQAAVTGTVVGPVGSSFNAPVPVSCPSWTGDNCTRQASDPAESTFSLTDNAGDGWIAEMFFNSNYQDPAYRQICNN